MPPEKAIAVAVVGASGYSAGELLRLLSAHPGVAIRAISSRSYEGKPLGEAHPHLRALDSLVFQHPDGLDWGSFDLVFFATPSGVAMRNAPKVLKAGARVIDVSSDFRMQDVAEWERWYKIKHAAPQLLAKAVYGIPEFYSERIAETKLLANPGCYPTAILLALLPLLKAKCVDPGSLRAVGISGLSGAGKKMESPYMLTEAHASVNAYAISGHRHLPEMMEQLRAFAPDAALEFVPHLAPMSRGIYATIFADTVSGASARDAHAVLDKYYSDALFVDVLPMGTYPRSGDVCGSNVCRLGLSASPGKGRLTIFSAIDNLIKGASGLAVENMNIMFGLPADTGLTALGMRP